MNKTNSAPLATQRYVTVRHGALSTVGVRCGVFSVTTAYVSRSASPERFQAASLPREEGGAACCSFAIDPCVEAHLLLCGPLDVIEAREEADRRLTALVDAIAAYLGGVD